MVIAPERKRSNNAFSLVLMMGGNLYRVHSMCIPLFLAGVRIQLLSESELPPRATENERRSTSPCFCFVLIPTASFSVGHSHRRIILSYYTLPRVNFSRRFQLRKFMHAWWAGTGWSADDALQLFVGWNTIYYDRQLRHKFLCHDFFLIRIRFDGCEKYLSFVTVLMS